MILNSFKTTALVFGIFILISQPNRVWAHDHSEPQGLSSAKAAELALHRIEKLVFLKKIESSFQTKFIQLNLEVLVQKLPSDPLFKAVASQPMAADGTQKKVEIILDAQGRTLQTYITKASEAETVPNLADKDPLTIAELSLHFLIDNVESKPELDVFADKLLSLSLAQVSTPEGKVQVFTEIKTAGVKETLLIRSNSQGEVESFELVKRP